MINLVERSAPWLLSAVLIVVLGASCAQTASRSEPPADRPVAIRTCVANANVRVEGAGITAAPQTTDARGDATFAAIPGAVTAFNLHLSAPGYNPYSRVVELPAGAHQFVLGPCVAITDAALQIPLPPWTRPLTDTGERGAVHVDGVRFVRADGSTFQWRGTDGFLLYQRWLEQREGIDPIVENWLNCAGLCAGSGPNVVRVLGMVTTFSHFHPQEHADYYAELRPFVDHLWTTFHLRVEFVIFADAQIVMPDRGEQERHAHRVLDWLATAENVFLEVANEPFKNIPGNGPVAAEIGRTLQGRGIPIASGDYNEPWLTALDYITLHTDRGEDWPRSPKSLLDIRNGDVGDGPSRAGRAGWRGNRPIIGDEPMGFAEVEIRGSRSTSADDAAYYAAACSLLAAGCTFHSDAGLNYGPYGPIQAAAAAAFFGAMHFVPPDAQLAAYQRGAEAGGGGIGNMPLEHSDALALRTYCKETGGAAYCVAIRPKPGWRAIGRAGWKVAEQPRAGLVKLTR